MIKNVAIPFIEEKDCRDGNIHAFGIVNTEWVPKGAVLRKLEIRLKSLKRQKWLPDAF